MVQGFINHWRVPNLHPQPTLFRLVKSCRHWPESPHEELLQSQYAIGCCQFAQGCISIQVRFAIAEMLQLQGHKNPANGAVTKIKQLIHLIWDCDLALWKSWNVSASTSLHKNPSIQRQKWEAMASYFYQNQHEFPHDECCMVFSKPLSSLLKSTEKQLSWWCTQVQAAFHSSVAWHIKQVQGCHRSISDFFSGTSCLPGNSGTP